MHQTFHIMRQVGGAQPSSERPLVRQHGSQDTYSALGWAHNLRSMVDGRQSLPLLHGGSNSRHSRRGVHPRLRAKEPNPYLFKLERKRRLPTLAHDFGKGSPCGKCEHNCPGLELHYWKDICLNCGCHLNEHLKALSGLGPETSSISVEIGKLADRPDRASCSHAASLLGPIGGGPDEEQGAVEPGRTLDLARKFQEWMIDGAGPLQFQNTARKSLNDDFRRDSNDAAWLPGKPVETAPVEKSHRSTLVENLPRPTPTSVITVTSSASPSMPSSPDGVGTPTAASETLLVTTSSRQGCLRCEECRRVFNTGQTAVVIHNMEEPTASGGEAAYWHPHCFRCHKCRCLLKDNKCYSILNRVYCAEHFAEVNGLPRCTACNGWIFDDEFVWSKSHAYHKNHFLCCCCAEPMEDEYILHNGRALCARCFFAEQGRVCRTCKSLIDPEEPLIENGLLAWHLNRSCFCCHVCHQLLDKSSFETLGSRVFCDRNCKDVFVTQLALRHKAREMRVKEAAQVH